MEQIRTTMSRLINAVYPKTTVLVDHQDLIKSVNCDDAAEIDAPKRNSQSFEVIGTVNEIETVEDQDPEQETPLYMLQNMYVNQVLIEKDEAPRVLNWEEWKQVIRNQDFNTVCRKNLVFSILKGIPFQVRKDLWEVLAETNRMRVQFRHPYQYYLKLPHGDSVKYIEKDVPRTSICQGMQKELKNILVAYSNLDPAGYCQGMNLIVGSLLNLLVITNDKFIGDLDFQVEELEFEERVFWVFVGIMYAKNWRECSIGMLGVRRMLAELQRLMKLHLPDVLCHIYNLDMDLNMCFSQYYLTLLIYNTPRGLAKRILDLFLLQGQNALHCIILRMLSVCRQKILSMTDISDLIRFMKVGMLQHSYQLIGQQKEKACQLEDFGINFFRVSTGV